MWVDKAGTFAMARELGGDTLLRIVVEDTHTCYLGDRTHRHSWGYGCGGCPACALRAEGWARWRAPRGDPVALTRPGPIGETPGRSTR
jgi:7-cyano-7-deazaguanine synthase